MINIVKTTGRHNTEQCNACGRYHKTTTDLRTAIQPGIWSVLKLCPDCIRALTKELTSNKYLNPESCNIMIGGSDEQ